MSRARHHEKHKHERAKGGRVGMVVSGNPDVLEEAHEEHKKGGRVKKKHMEAEGKKPHHRMDRPKRAKGGRVSGSDQNPFSSARKGGSAGEKSGGEPD